MNEIISLYSLPVIILGMFFALLLLNYVMLYIKNEHEKSWRRTTLFMKFTSFIGIMALSTLLTTCVVGIIVFGFASETLLLIFAGVFSINFFMQSRNFLLRKTKVIISFTGLIKDGVYGLVIVLPLFVFATYLSSFDFDNKNFSAVVKANRYAVGSPFVRIDRETLIEIEPHVQSFSYESLGFDLNQEGPSFFVKPKVKALLVSHLKRKKASEEFLVSLYEDFDQNKEEWAKSKHFEGIKYLAFHSWPKDKELPERFVTLKQTAREIASQKD